MTRRYELAIYTSAGILVALSFTEPIAILGLCGLFIAGCGRNRPR